MEEVGDEAAHFRAGLTCEIGELLKPVRIDVLLIQSHVEFALNLRAGTLGIPQEPDEFLVASTVKALGNVVHDRTGGPLNLILQAEVLGKRTRPRCVIHLTCEFPPQLPTLNTLETFDFHQTEVSLVLG